MTKFIDQFYKLDKQSQKQIEKLYHSWVLEQNCCFTGSQNVSRPHHHRQVGYCGMGQKPDMIWELPITYQKHTEIHTKGVKAFARRYKIDFIDLLTKLHEQFCEEMDIEL